MFKDDITLPEAAHLPKPTRYRRGRIVPRGQRKKKTYMKAAAIEHFGSPAVLKLHRIPAPQLAPGEVLIAVHAAGVGVWDAEIRGGWWPGKRPKFPLVLGTDGAGTIAAVGRDVKRFHVGEQVWAYTFLNSKGGFYAEYVAVKATDVGRVPRRLDLVHAGAAAVTGLTAQQGIDQHLHVRKGETVLIFGGSGAVGTLAIQFAKRHGAHVIATASGNHARMLVKRLGADHVFDARGKNAMQELRRFAPDGIDAVLALASGEALDRCLEMVCPGGRLAYPNGVEPEPRKRAHIHQSSYNAKGGRREFDDLRRAARAAHLRVPVAKVYTLAQASKAHAQIERGGVAGRIVLRIR